MSALVLTVLDGADQVASLRLRAARAERLAAELAAEVSELTAEVTALAGRPPAEPPALLSVDTTARVLGLSRTTAFALVRDGELASVKVGARRLVPRAAIEAFISAGLAGRQVSSRAS